jgi:hypothetical protein
MTAPLWRDCRSYAGNLFRLALLTQNLIDLGLALHLHFLRFDYCLKQSIVLPQGMPASVSACALYRDVVT